MALRHRICGLSAGTTLLTVGIVVASLAQTVEKPNDVAMPPVIELPPEQIDPVSGLRYWNSGPVEFRPSSTRSLQVLLTETVTWLSDNFDLPAIPELPRVEFASVARIASLHYEGVLSLPVVGFADLEPGLPARYKLLTMYDEASKTIYLPEGWSGSTPTELSVLVHEMVHHAQNVSGLKYECPQARERLAYAAQQKWLELFGHDLQRDFEISPYLLAISTQCSPFP